MAVTAPSVTQPGASRWRWDPGAATLAGVTTRGTVRLWHDEEGWGVVDSAGTPGGCWAHFSAVLVEGYRALHAGQEVAFDPEAPGQDGFAYRALRIRPVGEQPVVPPVSPPGAAYTSTLELGFDDDERSP